MTYYLSSLLYPVRGEGKYRLFFAVPIMWLFVLAGWAGFLGVIAQFLIISYMAVYLMKMLHASADEESNDEMCEFPGADGQALFLPYVRFLGVSLFCLAPAIIAEKWLGCDGWVIWSLLILGLFYFPMALIRVMLSEDILELSPLGWWRSVKKVLIPYVGLVIISFVVLLGVSFLRSPFELFEFVSAPLIFLILAIGMNILGKFYRKHEEKIGW